MSFDTQAIDALIHKPSSHFQLTTTELYNKILKREEAELTELGAINAKTGEYTGRSPKDKYIVDNPQVKDDIDWGPINQPISEEKFLNLYYQVIEYLDQKEEVFVFNGYAGSDKDSQLDLTVVNEFAWHNLFAQNLFIKPSSKEEASKIKADFTIISAPTFKANPEKDGTRSETFVIISFKHKTVLIGGTEYAGEMKKSIFSVMNYLLPEQDIMSMHCSANVGHKGDVALFFGLSGTGKTTLSADPNRKLIGDDEHGWNENGVFNIEGGCYAKAIHLSEEKEPQIFNAIRYGTVLENCVVDAHGYVDFDDNKLTENTRAAYPIHHIDNIVVPSKASHPNTIIFLTADAFGVLPPISKLSKDQAMYHFLSGFTSKLAGTERGITEPQPSFSTCFGAPFLPLNAKVYADLLGRLIDKHDVDVYLVNTGWTGGKYGEGNRIELRHTRKMVNDAISGKLKNSEFEEDHIFGLSIPKTVEDVPTTILQPINAWTNKEAYDKQARDLVARFKDNFKKFGPETEHLEKSGGFKG
ncbi:MULTISPECIES: phosphoenolpyruvate carboxykinase (ATP) [Staphylococcus]|uniref:Phosphoenolpyruvate carboxykinase (ATP) n=1 Tax=Staphylococcus chromogenes TaxID=46126 RepID=A0AAJ2N8U5_STACR|nr:MULTISPECIES: phosphoenolpyruvate carboxykinase (ATP) [Staphylococcus]KDP13113.1 phosphoenolpyruvate carboxykinase [Staphylococcus chromogenes MU 970]MBP0045549.1 phosphoenolpyruvate carboxykinase (ATP) [Staphylococcus chromogenes]MBV5137883.1 phosphoenolpyruvate carboxykinase (ATP) [Staphylococcus chromogenes]MBW6088078.1 phosphoenolpyruvate carboxykinase (ATP) [Staphylococcus chromogenes]MCD9061428.1 phosphoenolpyruvate carboxykinase (ATP) [Staphylococcus chromogenes]